jgi:hypothetical protein
MQDILDFISNLFIDLLAPSGKGSPKKLNKKELFSFILAFTILIGLVIYVYGYVLNK